MAGISGLGLCGRCRATTAARATTTTKATAAEAASPATAKSTPACAARTAAAESEKWKISKWSGLPGGLRLRAGYAGGRCR